jgi:hypothetical protein
MRGQLNTVTTVVVLEIKNGLTIQLLQYGVSGTALPVAWAAQFNTLGHMY